MKRVALVVLFVAAAVGMTAPAGASTATAVVDDNAVAAATRTCDDPFTAFGGTGIGFEADKETVRVCVYKDWNTIIDVDVDLFTHVAGTTALAAAAVSACVYDGGWTFCADGGTLGGAAVHEHDRVSIVLVPEVCEREGPASDRRCYTVFVFGTVDGPFGWTSGVWAGSMACTNWGGAFKCHVSCWTAATPTSPIPYPACSLPLLPGWEVFATAR